ncbi:hypothetical protein [Methanobacterium formicicum]|uniref:hypothetical protein n=1 Tax=Methanobacterium formicicum TaxID=2162 RepID=UPI002FE256D0
MTAISSGSADNLISGSFFSMFSGIGASDLSPGFSRIGAEDISSGSSGLESDELSSKFSVTEVVDSFFKVLRTLSDDLSLTSPGDCSSGLK